MKEKNNTTQSLVAMLNSTSKIEFNEDLATMNSIVNSDGTDARLNVLIATNSRLDEIVYTLTSYFVQSNTQINNEEIAKALRTVLSSRSTLEAMIDEYFIKKESAYFDRHLGANDFYKEMSYYLKNYARFASLLNNYVSLQNKNNDVKFSMIEVYTDVVRNTFSLLNEDARIEISNKTNINEVNLRIAIHNFHITTSLHSLSINGNYFIKYYNLCNKQEFAKNIATYISSVSTVTEDSTYEEVATYYYKLYFGI